MTPINLDRTSTKCGAKTRTYGNPPCKRVRGWGTQHVGFGRCRFHGGNTPNGIKAAAQEEAMLEVERARSAVMGTALDVDPMDALLWCVRITAGEVAYATQKVHALEEDQEIVRPVTDITRAGGGATVADSEQTQGPEELNLWIKVRQTSLERLAKFSKMALDAGVAQRAIALAENAGEPLAIAIRSILDGLDLTQSQEERAPQLVRDALSMLEGVNPAGQALLDSSGGA